MISTISLAELVASGLRLRPAEAVAIVGEICRQCAAGLLRGVPPADGIRLTAGGEIAIEGPVAVTGDPVARAARLLEALLGDFDAPPEYRASGALRLVISRGLRTLDLPPYPSLESFCADLARFTTADTRETVAALLWTPTATNRPDEANEMPLDTVLPADTAASRVRTIAMSIAGLTSSAVLGYVLATITERPSAPVVTAPAAQPAPIQRQERPRVLQASAYSPAFAASGAVYFHQQTAGTSALKMGESAGKDRLTVTTILDDHAKNFHVRPSPDGSLIAYDSDRDGVRGVFVARSDGGGAHRLSGTGYAAVPSWSPDGRRIAFVRAEAGRVNVWNLWIANADGSQLRRLTRHAVGQAWGGSWFPDGRRIAYSVESRLVILDLTTGRPVTLQSPIPGRLVRTPAVSPDGRRIIFQVRHDGTWVADVASGRMTRVLDDPTAEEFAWAADGHRVAYHSRRSGTWSVWVMTL